MKKEIVYMVTAECSGESYSTKTDLVGIFKSEEAAKHVCCNCKYPAGVIPVQVGRVYPLTGLFDYRKDEIILGTYAE